MLLKKKETLAKSEEDLSQQEQCAREEVKAADELMYDAKSKVDNALESNTISKSSITAAKMMLETATTKQKEAMEKLDKIQEQRKSFRATAHKLLAGWDFTIKASYSKEKNKSNRKKEQRRQERTSLI